MAPASRKNSDPAQKRLFYKNQNSAEYTKKTVHPTNSGEIFPETAPAPQKLRQEGETGYSFFKTDPLGSYTGIAADGGEPTQDVDDL